MTIDELRRAIAVATDAQVCHEFMSSGEEMALDHVLAALPALLDMAEAGNDMRLAAFFRGGPTGERGAMNYHLAGERLAALPGPGKDGSDE